MSADLNPASVSALLSAGRAREALAIARRGAASHPQDANWRYLLGASLHACGENAQALAELRNALSLEPRDAFAWNALGAVLIQLGDPVAAETALVEALRLDGDSMEARFHLALALKQRGEWGAARLQLEQLLRARPDVAAARFELAGLMLAESDAASALPHLEALLEKSPDSPRVLSHLAAAHAALGRPDLASAACDRVLSDGTASAIEIAAIAYTLGTIGRVREAVDSARRAISAAPDSPEVRSSAAGALAHAGYPAEAQEHFAAVAAHHPRIASSWRKLGLAALAAGDWPGAAKAFKRQLALAPVDRVALLSLGVALNERGEREDAIAAFERALQAGHRDAEILSALVQAKGTACDWKDMDALVAELRTAALSPGRTPAQPQSALYIGTTASEQRAWAESWSRSQFPQLPSAAEAASGAHESRRIRIGYLSSDFYDHPTARLMAGFIEHHDRARFEVFAYSAGPDDGSALRRRFIASVDHFVDIRGLPGRAAVARIAADRLDVLLDLGGYVKNSCTGILAWRPAPVQGQFLGYPGTTGAPFVDFVIADPFVIPEGRESDFTERVLRMPACYQPNDPARADPAPRPRSDFGLPEGALILCSFNQALKIRPAVFAQWCRMLEALPQALLWLLDNGEASNARLRAFAKSRNVDPARVLFAPGVPQEEHIARLRNADIALDTFPYTSHTTASDAIWAGVPLVTTYGETFASRVAASVLRAAGCGDWAFDDPERAFEATLALARDAPLREAVRARFAAARSSTLFDAAAFARAFEALIERSLRLGGQHTEMSAGSDASQHVRA